MAWLMIGVIFDLDGTLADSAHDIAAALNHVLARHGFGLHDERAVRRMVGDGAAVLIERAAPGASPVLRATLLAEYREHYLGHMLDSTRPYDGVPELLRALTLRAVLLGVLSNKPEPATRALVAALFPDVRFRAIHGQRPARPIKPDPAAALGLGRALGLEPDRCVLVGDSGVDVQTAIAAGMLPVGVAWGFRGREELVAQGAFAVLERPAELLELLAAWPKSRE
jgi:phosphoglycolate phosphatase